MKTQVVAIPHDVRLADYVSDKLRAGNHPTPDAWRLGLHPDALRVPDQDIQRFLINRRLRSYIGNFEGDTLAVLTCLIDDGSLEDWARLLDQAVIPCMLKH